VTDLSGQRFSVLGLARTGVAAANYLARHGADVVASDLREPFDLPLDDLDPRVDVRAANNFVRPGDTVIISPGIKPHTSAWNLAHEQGSEVLSDIELFYRLAPCPIVAITGTDGKSTTTALIGRLFEATGRKVFVGGNIGTACMLGLEGLGPDDVAVLEVSCFQLTHCPTFRPAVAVITNIAEDHVEYHGSMAAYIEAKQQVYANMGEGTVVVANGDDPEVSTWTFPDGATVVRFGWRNGLDAWADKEATHLPGGLVVPHRELRLKGLHNVENVMAAALALGDALPGVLDALREFPGLEHRMEYVATVNGVEYYNDTKATNPHAAMAVLNAFGDERFWLLAGGYEKGSDFADLGRLIAERTLGVFLYGQTRERIAATIPDGHRVVQVETLEQAVGQAHQAASAGEKVILAPACASFDQFKDYEQRGRIFKELVRALPNDE
jgi:UDP-N-acetylmuramoylalanine--D-glutamate ligase